jgi:GNAT superfamily N-acetyltransferase
MTDLLGVCLSWDGEVCVVQPEDGPTVTIPIGLIVSGKPVPPRPSVRSRVSVDEVVRRAAAMWPQDSGDEFRLAAVARARRGRPRPTATVDLTAGEDRVFASIGTGCDPVAEAEAGIDGDWIGIRGLFVEVSHRRQGLATALVAELLGWGAERGATTAWVRVDPADAGALAACESLGFDVTPSA